MKKLLAILLVLVLVLSTTAFAENKEIYSLEETMTALLSVYISTGEGHPTDDPVRNDYASSYLFALASLFYGSQAEAVPELEGNFDLFVKWDSAYVDGLLFRAFGPAFGVEDLQETGVVHQLSGDWYVAVADPFPVSVVYVGEDFDQADNTATYPFAYTYSPFDDDEVSGELTVYLSADEEIGWAYVAAFSVDMPTLYVASQNAFF